MVGSASASPVLVVALGLGWLMAMGGTLWLIVLGFMERALWGVLLLFFPCASVVFAVQNWKKARWAFVVQVVGFVLVFGSGVVQGATSYIERARAAESTPAGLPAR